MLTPAARFLLVERDIEARIILERWCGEFGSVLSIGTLAELRVLSNEHHLTAAIVRGAPSGAPGLALLREFRKSSAWAPLLLVTDSKQAKSELGSLHVEIQARPLNRRHVRGFLQRAIAFERLQRARLCWLLESVAREYRLPLEHIERLAIALAKIPRSELSAELGTTSNTLAEQIRELLREPSGPKPAELGRELLVKVFGSGSFPWTESLGIRSAEDDRAV